jgi:methylated-DNA-protein-cysteine methyltransferase-like protein
VIHGSPEEPSQEERIAEAISRIPEGRVSTYGAIAALAGNPRAARQVVRVLHVWSSKRSLPWHRVINRRGEISLPEGAGLEEQRSLLQLEGVEFDEKGRVDLQRFGWP